MHICMHAYLHTYTPTYVHACMYAYTHPNIPSALELRFPISCRLQFVRTCAVDGDIFACAYVHKTHICIYGTLQTPVVYPST